MDFNSYKLSDILEIIGGGTPKRSEPTYWNGEIPWLSVVDFNNNERFVNESTETITKLGLEKSSTKLLDKGDLIISARGTVGALAQLTKKMAFNQSCYGLRAKLEITENNFLYYLVKFKITELQQKTHGAVFDTITRETFKHIHVKIPHLKIQQKIAKVLGDLDKKITLNNQINETLEAMAQALFKSWFIDFEPVKAKMEAKDAGADETEILLAAMSAISGKDLEALKTLQTTAPEEYTELKAIAEQFPDSLEESELGMIPKGWEVKPLDEIAEYHNGLALQKFRPDDPDNYLPIVKIAELRSGKANHKEKASPDIRKNSIIDNGDVIFSWSGTLLVDIWCGGKAALNQHLFKVVSENYPKWFFYFYTKYHLSNFQKIANDKAVTMGHIKRSHLKEALCLIPTSEFLMIDIIDNLLKQKIDNALSNETLTELRDTLLPKLLSGEIDVSNVEIDELLENEA